MYFSDVFDQESRGIEPASRYNAVNMLLRSEFSAAEENVSGGRNGMGILTFVNTSGKEISRFTAVAVTGYHESDGQLTADDRLDGSGIVCGEPAENELLPWGIALSDTLPGEYGEVAVSGCVPAVFTGIGPQAAPGSGGLAAGSSGSARVITVPESRDDGTVLPGFILLGSGGAADSKEYHGIFKIAALSQYSAEIINGTDPASGSCGLTDVPYAGQIPRCVMNFSDLLKKNIYLVFFYAPANKTYRAEFMTAIPDDAVFYSLIGTFQGGKVTQIYQSTGQRMIFGEKWYLK